MDCRQGRQESLVRNATGKNRLTGKFNTLALGKEAELHRSFQTSGRETLNSEEEDEAIAY
eukprot:716161-Pelagomonas_calceolata.AAC.2